MSTTEHEIVNEGILFSLTMKITFVILSTFVQSYWAGYQYYYKHMHGCFSKPDLWFCYYY